MKLKSAPFILDICSASVTADPIGNEERIPPFITYSIPVPAQAIHFRNPRRSTPSLFRLSRIKLPIVFSPLAGAGYRVLATRGLRDVRLALKRLIPGKSAVLGSG